MKQPSVLQRLIYNAILIVVTLLTLYPVLWVVKSAFSTSQALSISPLPSEISLDNFKAVLGAESLDGKWLFGRQLWNSVVVSVATTILGIVLSTTAAYAFSRFEFPGRKAGLGALLVTQMFPGVVVAVPLYILLRAVGLLNSMIGLIMVYSMTAIPFCIWMLKGYLDTIPKELEEAAIMDGASRWTIFVKVILPLSKPAIVVTALFSFMTAWNEYILAYTFMTQELNYTLPVSLQQHIGEHDVKFGLFAAGAIIVSVPVMALFFALQKHLIGGLTAGGVKG